MSACVASVVLVLGISVSATTEASGIVDNADPIGQDIMKFLNSQVPEINEVIDKVVPNPLVLSKTVSGQTTQCVPPLCLCEATANYDVQLNSVSGLNMFKIARFTNFALIPAQELEMTMSVQFASVDLSTFGNAVHVDLSVCGIASEGNGQWSAGVTFQNEVMVKLKPVFELEKPCMSFDVVGSGLDLEQLAFVNPEVNIDIAGLQIDLDFINQLISEFVPRIKEEIQQKFAPMLNRIVTEVGCIGMPYSTLHNKSNAVFV